MARRPQVRDTRISVEFDELRCLFPTILLGHSIDESIYSYAQKGAYCRIVLCLHLEKHVD